MHNEKLFIEKSDSVEVSQRKNFANQINDQTENQDQIENIFWQNVNTGKSFS